jgi:radical SAM superfamily enzyme YgiQ (UPF0313 family)
LLIGFQQEANLGIGYLASTLRQAGYRVEICDFQLDKEEVLKAAQSLNPLIVGFSLIFQFYVDRFAALATYLRENGIDSHFTIGGHFPSLSYQDTLKLIPEIDSVVRFEGELTLLELADVLGTGGDWRTIEGIAFHNGSEPVANPLRHLVHDLDDLPYPDRSYRDAAVLGRRITPVLASRGCARTCSFCSIHMFYRAAPGKVVRTRDPKLVVEEMVQLHEERGTTTSFFFRTTTSRYSARCGGAGPASSLTRSIRLDYRRKSSGKSTVAPMSWNRNYSPKCGTPASTWSTWVSNPAASKASKHSTKRSPSSRISRPSKCCAKSA